MVRRDVGYHIHWRWWMPLSAWVCLECRHWFVRICDWHFLWWTRKSMWQKIKNGKISLEVIPLPNRWHICTIFMIYIYIHVRHVTFALYLFSSCSPLVDGNSPLQAWVAILLVTTTGEIVFKGILAPTMPTFCYHVRASWVWLFDSQGCFFEHEADKLFSGKKEFDDLILMLFLKTKGWCKDMRKPKSTYLLFELVPWKHVVLFLHVQLNNADSESTVIFSDDDS